MLPSFFLARTPARRRRWLSCLTLLLGVLGLPSLSRAQRVVSGQVVEAATGEPVPFVFVFVPRTSAGVTADLEGKFRLCTLPYSISQW